MRTIALAIPLALVLALLVWSRGDACCPAFPPGPDTTVRIASQEILVSWNPDSKVENFVRQASFESKVAGFGFLVPTPERPMLSETDPAIFARLRKEIEPRVVHEDRYVPAFTALCLAPFAAGGVLSAPQSATKGGDAGVAESVHVLETKRVGGYEAAVLAATDAGALASWLEQNGYDARPALREWLEPYVAGGWIVTAFKFVAGSGDVATGSLRMSFKTDKPLFPYRVPTDQLAAPGKQNTLRVFYVGAGRGSGAIGPKAAPWAGVVKYASPSPSSPFSTLIGAAIPATEMPSDPWLTAFEDPTWPSGTEDLWFESNAGGDELIPKIVIPHFKEVPVPVDVIAFVVFGTGFLVRRARRKRLEDAPAK